MKKPKLKKTEPLFENTYVNVYDLVYEDGRHYYDASRRRQDDLLAAKEEAGLPDAVSAFVILSCEDGKERLLLFHEYRYPAGRFVLSIPSGLIDEEDRNSGDPAVCAILRELKEETGLILQEGDEVKVISPFVFCTPGLSDESTALIAVHARLDSSHHLSQSGAEGTEVFDGFELVTAEEAEEILQRGTDSSGEPYPLVTWAAMMYFLSECSARDSRRQ